MQKLIVALTLLFGGIAANDRDGHSRLLRGRGIGRRPHDTVASFAEMAESRFPFPLLCY